MTYEDQERKVLKAISFWLAAEYEKSCRYASPVGLDGVISAAEKIYNWINKSTDDNGNRE